MKEIVITQYVAEDGETFKTKEKCLAYEEKCKETCELRKAIRKIKEICNKGECHFCPFNKNDNGCCYANYPDSPAEWDIPEG